MAEAGEIPNPQPIETPKPFEEVKNPQSTKPEKRGFTRRQFLKALGIASGGAALYLGLKPYLEFGSSENKSKFTPTEDESIRQFISNYGFQAEKVKEMIVKENLPDESYGILAASAVTFIPVVEKEGKREYYLGSGGVAEYKGRYYLTTAMHVLEKWLKNPDIAEIHFSIPGFSTPYKTIPTELGAFNPHPELDKDEPVFIELADERIINEIDMLKARGQINPLIPITYYPEIDKSPIFFRFQGSQPSLQSINVQSFDEVNDVIRYNATINSGKNLSCGGTSGTPILRRIEDQITNKFIGVLTHGDNQSEKDDAGVLPAECGTGLKFGSFQDLWFRSGMRSRRTLVG